MSPTDTVAETPVSPAFHYPDLPIDQLHPSPLNPRKSFDVDAIAQLAASIGSVGILEPLVVRPVGDHYEIVCGERRYRAALQAALATVPASVRPLTDDQALEIMVIENLQREDVNPLEEGDGFARLLQAGYGLEQLGARIGRSRKYIYDRIKLGALIPEAQALLTDGTITAGHAILLARLRPADQVRAIDPDDGGLFIYDLQDDDVVPGADDAPPPKIAVSVREFDAWIDRHVRLDLATPIASEDFPAVARAQEMAARVVSITLQPFLDPRQEAGASAAGDRILTSDEWKRADGTTEHPLHGRSITHDECPQSLLGVVVIGREKGTTFPVCVERSCDIHWKKDRAEAPRRPAPAADDDEWEDDPPRDETSATEQKRRDVERQQWQAKQDRDKADRDAYRLGTPAILAAFVACVKKTKPAVLTDAVLTGAALHPKALAAFPTPKTAEDLLRLLAVSMVADGLYNEWTAPQQVPLWAKRFGLDLKPLLKPAKTAVHTSAQTNAASRKIAPQPKPKPKGKKKAGKGRR